jgi:D-xylose transport system substrate-binding protein
MTNRRFAAAVAAASLLLSGFVATTVHAAAPQVGVVLPDSASSPRWVTDDQPLLIKAFKAAGVTYDIKNAAGSIPTFTTDAQAMLTEGVKVLVLVNLDSPSAAAVEAAAKKQGVATIDYDRLTLGGSANYYVSFNNVAVGVLQGQGIVACLTAHKVKHPRVVYLNGSPTDNNATLFKQGYASVVGPYLKKTKGTLVDDKSVAGWDNTLAGTIFEQQLTKAGNKLDAVVSANEGLGLAAVAILKKHKLNGKTCVSGQDASAAGLAAILTGDLSNTVYKPIAQEANAAAALAISLVKGTKAVTNGSTADSTVAGRKVPSVLLVPTMITKKNVEVTVTTHFRTAAEICAIAGAAACAANGVK